MKKKILFFGILYLLTCVSCMTESNNLSPLTSNYSEKEFANFSTVVNETNDELSKNVYAADISKLTANFPSTSNKKFNQKTSLLKYQIQYYLEVNDTPSLETEARKKVISTYKKIQDLYYKLPEAEQDKVRIHLVKIKTNLTKLKS